jgi:transcriptional regulator with XRE-family HTH domain
MERNFSEKMNFVNDASLSQEVRKGRRILRERGWTYESAAEKLGYSVTHLSWVLTGRRDSARVLEAISQLPNREEVEA